MLVKIRGEVGGCQHLQKMEVFCQGAGRKAKPFQTSSIKVVITWERTRSTGAQAPARCVEPDTLKSGPSNLCLKNPSRPVIKVPNTVSSCGRQMPVLLYPEYPPFLHAVGADGSFSLHPQKTHRLSLEVNSAFGIAVDAEGSQGGRL